MSTEKKLTAVEWLVEHLTEYGFNLKLHKVEIQRAKEMFKQQIFDAYWDGCYNWDNEKKAEQYYEQTFKN